MRPPNIGLHSASADGSNRRANPPWHVSNRNGRSTTLGDSSAGLISSLQANLRSRLKTAEKCFGLSFGQPSPAAEVPVMLIGSPPPSPRRCYVAQRSSKGYWILIPVRGFACHCFGDGSRVTLTDVRSDISQRDAWPGSKGCKYVRIRLTLVTILTSQERIEGRTKGIHVTQYRGSPSRRNLGCHGHGGSITISCPVGGHEHCHSKVAE